jgi:hypothetical protein
MAEAVLASDWADPIDVDDYLFNPLSFEAAGTSLLLDTSPMSDVARAFGGTAHTEEIFDGMPVIWHCYDTPKGRTTFVSLRSAPGNETMDPGPLVNVVIEEASPPAATGCTPSDTAAGVDPGGDIPTLGATRADIEARLGIAPSTDGHLAVTTHYLAGDEEAWTERKVIYYRFDNDVVTGVAYKQTTDLAFGGFIEKAVTGQFASAGDFEPRSAPRVALLSTGGLDIKLEVTSMQDVVNAYGGEINQTGEAGGHVVWICYAKPQETVWFYSDGEMGDGTVTGVAAETGTANAAWGCAPAPATLRAMQFDIPTRGATQAELDATFAPLAPDENGRLGFTSESPHPTEAGFKIWQDTIYRIGPDGTVDAVAIVQMSGD